ncbi:hypothetical protein [Nostoc sp. UHCC 0870]|uniref:hypothetical protein n=1 Tax=Nostoc sp. UHCC 0870 TaxID=2914041 RepID=UPI001EDED1FC|nr:hypothetical protein [Nostoc sp. UHCC 0870]UKO99024.1 hypothetical protein L6494_04660 [Nostoc sp. UHCC 0870]
MSYVSLIKNIPEFLSQPTGIAAIASVGIHGAIALIVPLMPVDSNQPKELSAQKTFGVLELSQADQSRLPQTPEMNSVALQPQLPLLQNQFPQQPQLNNIPNLDAQTTVLPPLPPPVNTPLSMPPLATIPENYRIPSLPQRQPLRVSPKRNFRFDDSTFNPANNKFATVTPPNFDNKQIVPEASKPLSVDKLPELGAATLPNDLPATPPAINTPNSNQATTQLGGDAANPITKTPNVGDDLALANQPIPKLEQGNTPNIPNLPSKQAEPGEIAQVTSYENLRKALQQQYPNSQEKAVIRSIIPTEKPGLDSTVLGVLVIDTEGKVLDIKFQDRLVSPELELKARQYFTRNKPKPDQQISRYPFSLRFQHGSSVTNETSEEKAPAVVIPNSGTNPGVNNGQATPKTEATSQPLPQLQINKNQPASNAVVKPPSEQTVNEDGLSSSLESGQDLIRKLQNLRETRQQKENSNTSKQ